MAGKWELTVSGDQARELRDTSFEVNLDAEKEHELVTGQVFELALSTRSGTVSIFNLRGGDIRRSIDLEIPSKARVIVLS